MTDVLLTALTIGGLWLCWIFYNDRYWYLVLIPTGTGILLLNRLGLHVILAALAMNVVILLTVCFGKQYHENLIASVRANRLPRRNQQGHPAQSGETCTTATSAARSTAARRSRRRTTAARPPEPTTVQTPPAAAPTVTPPPTPPAPPRRRRPSTSCSSSTATPPPSDTKQRVTPPMKAEDNL